MVRHINAGNGEGASKRSQLSAAAILISAATWSTAPLIIHHSAGDINPFVYNFVAYSGLSLLLIGFLMASKRKLLHEPLASLRAGTNAETAPQLHVVWRHLTYFRRVGGSASSEAPHVELVQPKTASQWLAVPLVFMILASFYIALLAWSTHYVETAIATTAYETWPAFVIYGLARHQRTDKMYRGDFVETASGNRFVTVEQRVLIAIGAFGLLFMLLSQQPELHSLRDAFASADSVIGIALALGAAVLGALSVIGSIIYGRALFYQYVPQSGAESGERFDAVDAQGTDAKKVLLWTTALGVTLARILSLPLMLTIGIISWDATAAFISLEGILGALTLGLVNTIATVLLRAGNLDSNNAAANSIYFLAPAAGLLLLAVAGIDLPRFDLFLIGAALILATNVLIQMNPDEERDHARFGVPERKGSRYGFTAFILSSWLFGSVILLRDEFLDSAWLNWSHDYWGLLALSSTIFALILGFRVARISARIGAEDQMLLQFFRDIEFAERRNLIGNNAIGLAHRLDTAKSSEMRDVYNQLRTCLMDSSRNLETAAAQELINSLEKQLDSLAHSKQLGRDIVELISLSSFAIITIGLGLLARPEHFAATKSGWNGFLGEAFMLVFACTVVFLCVNLFDVRREREAPLVVPLPEWNGDHRLFFRTPRKIVVNYVFAVLLTAIMMAVFISLLYAKWLQP